MQTVQFVVPGAPMTWKRVNMVRVGKKVRGVVDKDSKARKEAIGFLAQAVRPKGWPLDARYSVTISVMEPTRRCGDLDNYAKLVLDSCNGVLWDDDKAVDEIRVFRGPVSKTPSTLVNIMWMTKRESEEERESRAW